MSKPYNRTPPTEELKLKWIALRREGIAIKDIAMRFGYGKDAVSKAVKGALDDIATKPAESKTPGQISPVFRGFGGGGSRSYFNQFLGSRKK